MFYRLSEIKDCVGFLFGDLPGQDEPVPTGTCFFMELDGEPPSSLYLVTAKHVWEELKNGHDGFLRVTNPGGGIEVIKLDLARDQWVFHEDDSVDIAIQTWTRDRWQGRCSFTHWPIEGLRLPGTMGNLLAEGEDAIFVGLMRPFPGKEKNLVMLRNGMIGLLPDEPIHGGYGLSDYYVLDVQSYKANSGSPVYLISGGTFRLMGVLTHAFYDEAEKETVLGLPNTYFNLGVSLVTPVTKVEDILNRLTGK